MAAIPGIIKDEVVIIGCHRDGEYIHGLCRSLLIIVVLAWVLGAADPISGTASLHEVIRGYAALLKTGWKPLRTILFASWDAEEVQVCKLMSMIGC